MNPNKSLHMITLQFVGSESERAAFSSRLARSKEIKCLMYPNPTPTENWVYSHAHSLDYIVNTVVMIIATAGSISTIAHLIYDFLKDRAQKKELDRQIDGMAFVGKIPRDAHRVAFGKIENKLLVKSHSKTVEITGDFSKDDIIEILRATKSANLNEASDWLKKKKDRLKMREISEELRSTEEAIVQYKELLEVYERDDKLKPFQKEAYRKYKARMHGFENKAERLKKRLRQLGKR